MELIKIALSEFEPGVEGDIGCRRLNAEEHDKWVLKQSKLRLEEIQRKAALRKGLSESDAPEFFAPGFLSPDGLAATLKVSAEIFLDVVKEVPGGGEPKDFYQTLSMGARIGICARLMSSQTPSRREVPPS